MPFDMKYIWWVDTCAGTVYNQKWITLNMLPFYSWQ